MSEIDELAKIAQIPTKEPVVQKELNEAEKFAQANNVKPGNTKVAAMFIYEKYRKWRHNKNMLNRISFFKYFAQTFTKVVTPEGSAYMLDPEPFDMSQKAYWDARRKIRQEKENAQKEKDKKKQ